MKKQNLLTKLLLLCVMIVEGVNGVWADTVIKTIDFSEAQWSGVTFSQTSKTDPEVKNGVTFNSKHDTRTFSIKDGVLTFPDNNVSSGNYVMGFPVTGIVGGTVIIKAYNGSSSAQVKYAVKDGGTTFSTSDCGSGTTSSTGNPSIITKTGLTDNKAYIYIGRSSGSYKTITKIEILTYEESSLTEPLIKTFYEQTTTTTSAATLISAASLPSYISLSSVSMAYSSKNNESSVESPHDFTKIESDKTYYRLNPSSFSKIYIGGLSRVKAIHLYGNGTTQNGQINISVTKLSGTGTEMTIPSIDFYSTPSVVADYSTGDLTSPESGYDADTYYLYTISFTQYFNLWGIYIEAVPSSFTVSYDANGGSGSIDNSTGASITLSDGKGFTAPSGYSFAGWNTDAHGTGTSYSSGQENVKADLNLYAVWTQNGTIDANGGSADGAYTATYNKAVFSITSEPVNGSYAIKGYYKAGTGEDLVASSVGALEANTTYTDASGYWTHTGDAPILYAQWENTHELTVNVNDGEMGSAVALSTTLTEGEETDVTATANDGYKFVDWDVSGTGATLSSDTNNPTTLTMGTADATVTANFRELYTYTITYNKGAYGSGDAIDNDEKTEDADFTLSSSTFTYADHLQTGWATSDGGEKVYELGGSYTVNDDLDLYPFWIEQYTLTYDANEGTGSMSNIVGSGSITLTANTYTKTGYTFIGWATSQANADAGTVAYADKAEYTLSESTTLYAVWGENYCELKPATSSETALGKNVKIDIQSGGYGGSIYTVGARDDNYSASFAYKSSGFALQKGGADSLRVELNDYLKEGSTILLTLVAGGTGTRGLKIQTTAKSEVASLGWSSATANDVKTFSYTLNSESALKGKKTFLLQRNNTVYLKSLTVTDCQPGGVITASGWSTYSCNKKLDLSTISGGKAYVATGTEDGKVVVKSCTDIVDAEEGLMIWGTPGAKFTINTTSETSNLSETNLMVGVPNGGSAPVGSYVFGWPTASENPGNDSGFYYVNSAAATLGNTKAYLNTAGSGARLTIVFEDESETTGIGDVRSKMADVRGDYYDLQGRKVAQPTKGLYIVNGKKVIIK